MINCTIWVSTAEYECQYEYTVFSCVYSTVRVLTGMYAHVNYLQLASPATAGVDTFRIALARWLCLTLSNFMHLILPNATDSPTKQARANARVLWALASLFALASDSDNFNSLYEHIVIHSCTQTLCKYITQYTVSSKLYNTQVPVPTAEGDGLSRVRSGI